VSMCSTGFRFDSALAVYLNEFLGDPTECPPCPLDGLTTAKTLAGDFQDENCIGIGFGGAGVWTSLDQLGRNTLPGECFLVRVGSFPGSRGTGVVSVSCPEYAPTQPVGDPTGAKKSRFISFSIPGVGTLPGPETALRVKLVSLHHVEPPYTGGASAPFTAFEGQVRWVGPSTRYVESVSNGTPFYASQLQCDPYYQDWSTIDLLHVTGSAIVPSSAYEVENLAASCAGQEANCTAVAGPLREATARWGDVVEPFNPPPSSAQPDFGDIAALVDKFKSALGAPIKARALLAGTNASGVIDPSPDLGFTHISACVDAFKGLPYPYAIVACP